jgi:hypothetical protein
MLTPDDGDSVGFPVGTEVGSVVGSSVDGVIVGPCAQHKKVVSGMKHLNLASGS